MIGSNLNLPEPPGSKHFSIAENPDPLDKQGAGFHQAAVSRLLKTILSSPGIMHPRKMLRNDARMYKKETFIVMGSVSYPKKHLLKNVQK